MDGLLDLAGLVFELDEPVVIVLRHDPHPAAQRLLVAIGAGWIVDPVNGQRCVKRCGRPECRTVTVAPEVSAHDVLQSRSCVQPGCIFDAVPGSEYCADHPYVRPQAQRVGVGPLPAGSATPERVELARQVAELRAQGLLHREIQERLGISRTYVSDLLIDPDGSKCRARKASYRLPCPKCGTPMCGSNGLTGAPEQCIECAKAANHDERYWTRDQIIESFQSFHTTFARTPRASDVIGRHDSLYRKLSPTRRAEIDAARSFRLPSPWLVYREFGSWGAALTAAGFETATGGEAYHREQRRLTETSREVLALLEREGPQRVSELNRILGRRIDRTLQVLERRGLIVHPSYGRWALAEGVPASTIEGGTAMARMFVVFTRNGVGWIPHENVEAVTAELAIEKIATEEGEYVAIDARHWQPCTVGEVTRFAVVKEPQPS